MMSLEVAEATSHGSLRTSSFIPTVHSVDRAGMPNQQVVNKRWATGMCPGELF